MQPVLRKSVVILGERAAVNGMMIVKSLVADPEELEAWTVKEYAPGVEGVPEILPSIPRVKPSGSEPSERVHVMGVEPRALRSAE